MWWNWQTRRTQNPVGATPCGFNSHHRHHRNQQLTFYPTHVSISTHPLLCPHCAHVIPAAAIIYPEDPASLVDCAHYFFTSFLWWVGLPLPFFERCKSNVLFLSFRLVRNLSPEWLSTSGRDRLKGNFRGISYAGINSSPPAYSSRFRAKWRNGGKCLYPASYL